jgi:hypothetical protein
MSLWRCKVTGALPVRDALTKQDVEPGNEVVLSDSPGGKSGKWAGTLLAPLVEAGVIKVLGEYVEPVARKAES